MKKLNKISMSLLLILSTNISAKPIDNKEIIFYNDLTSYQEEINKDIKKSLNIDLSDTAIIDTFNVVVMSGENVVEIESLELHEKSEENIFKLNKNEEIYVNGEIFTLLENGDGFIKLKKIKNKKIFTTYIPKNKITEINFTKDVNSSNHIAKINLKESIEDAKVMFTYSMGAMKWKPKYSVYIKDNKNLELDYNIEIENNSLNMFEEVRASIVFDKINRINKDYNKSENNGIFDFEQSFKINGFNKIQKNNYNMGMMASENMMSKSSFINKHVLDTGSTYFKLPNKITIPPKSKTSYPFKSKYPIMTEKKNEVDLNNMYFVDKKNDTIILPNYHYRVKNKDGIPFKDGIVSVYSGKKGQKNILIGEDRIERTIGNQDFNINLGYNYGLELKISKNTIELLNKKYSIYNNEKELDSHKRELKKGKRLNNTFIKDIEFKILKNELSLNNKMKDDHLKIFYNDLIMEKDIEKIKSIINEINSKEEKERTKAYFYEIIEKLDKITKSEKEVNILKTKKLYLYKLKKKISYIDFVNYRK